MRGSSQKWETGMEAEVWSRAWKAGSGKCEGEALLKALSTNIGCF